MEDVPPKTRVSRNLLVWVFALVVIILAVGFFIFSEPAISPTDEGESFGVLPENPPDSVSVEVLENGERIVRNVEQGYIVKIKQDMYLYKNSEEDNLVVQDFMEPGVAYGGTPGCKVSVNVKNGSLENMEYEVSQMCKMDQDCEEYIVKEIELNKIKWYEVRYIGQFVGSNNPEFITDHNEKIYTLYFQCVDKNFIDNILLNFSL